MGWSSLLCMGEDSNGCRCVGERSSRRPRCFEQRHERKEARSHPVGGDSAAVSGPIRRKPKWAAMPGGKSEEAISVAVKARTAKPAGAKGLDSSHADEEGGIS